MAKMVWVRANQQFVARVGAVDVILTPGKVCEMPETQALEYQRAGYSAIIMKPDPQQVEALNLRPVQNYPTPPAQKEPDQPRKGVAIVIVNYNMPERADALAEYIRAHCGSQDYELILVDNGSDLQPPAKATTLRLTNNVQTTNGWLMGLHYADALAAVRGTKFFAYWFLITSAEFVGDADPLAPMLDLLRRDPSAVGVHPAVDADVIAWKHLLPRGNGIPRKAWMIDNIASLYRADWFDGIGRFDPALTYAWGIDLEAGYLARKQGRTLWVDERVTVKKVTDIGYKMQRMGMSAEERRVKAEENMERVLSAKYGPGWRNAFWNDYREIEDGALVSVIIPTHNRPSLLPRALESLKAQTYTNFEAIVINDGGTDVSAIVAKYPFARYLSHDKNRGLPAARNTGIRAAKGDYLAYLDDDDWYYTNHLEVAMKGMKGHRAIYTNAHAIDREDPPNGRYVFNCDYSPSFIKQQNVFPCNTVVHERALIEEAGWFDETLPNSEDWDEWIRISEVTPWHHIPVVTCAVDRTRPTMSSDRPAMMKIFEVIRARYADAQPVEINGKPKANGKAKAVSALPFGISGCVRVCNDGEFLYPAVVSHLPYCDEVVLAYQPSEDNTLEVCKRLAAEYPDKVRVCQYPHKVVYIDSPEWAVIPEDDPRSFVYLSNWALAQCRYSWIMKFEADVCAVSSLQKIVDAIKAEPNRKKYYGRVVLNVGGPDYRVINAKVPCNGGFDEAAFPNSSDYKFIRSGKYETIPHTVHEYECMGWSGIHLKHAKARYWGKINEPFVPFNEAELKKVMAKYLQSNAWPAKDNPLGEPCLFESGWRDCFPVAVKE